MQHDNPAARLLRILEAGQKLESHRTCRQCWDLLLDARGDSALLMARLGQVMELPRLTIEAIREHYPEQGDTWSHWESQVSGAFMVQNLHSQWQTFMANIDTHTVNYLRLAASLLHVKLGTVMCSDEQVAAVRQRVQEALDALLNADIPPQLKAQVVRQIKRILDALDEYRIGGSEALLAAAEQACGHAVFDSEYRAFLKENTVGKAVAGAIGVVANLVTIATGAKDIPSLVQQFFDRLTN